MTLKKFQQLKEYIDKIVAQLEKEAFEEGVNTTSDKYLEAVEDIVRNVLQQKGVPYEQYKTFEKSIGEWSELGEGDTSFFPQLSKNLKETKLKERIDGAVDDFTNNLSQLKQDVIENSGYQNKELVNKIEKLGSEVKLQKIAIDKKASELEDKFIRSDIRNDSNIDNIKKALNGLEKVGSDTEKKIGKIKIPKQVGETISPTEKKRLQALIKEDWQDVIQNKIKDLTPRLWHGAILGVMNRIGTKFSTEDFVDDEPPTGAVNGSNKVFTLTTPPNPVSSLKVYVNGQRQVLTTDYTLSGKTLTTTVAYPAGTAIRVDYKK